MTDSTDRPLHLAVALDGTGFHPAAGATRRASPAELFTAAYWTALARTAERGLLDFLTIEDSFGLQSSRFAGPDGRTDQVRGRLDAVLIASLIGPVTQPHRPRADRGADAHRTVPPRVGDRHARLRQHADAPVGGRRSPAGRPRRPTSGCGRSPSSDRRISTIPRGSASCANCSTRRPTPWRSCAGCGTAGRTTPIIKDVATGRYIDRDKLHYVDFEGRFFSVKGPSIVPRPPQGNPVVAALAHSPVPFEFAARSADVVFVTPRRHAGRRAAGSTTSALPERTVERAQAPLQVFADLVVFLDDDRVPPSARKEHLDDARRPAVPLRRRDLRRHADGAGRSAARRGSDARARRLPPATRRDRPRPRRHRRRRSCPSCSGAARSAPTTTTARCVSGSVSPRPRSRYATAGTRGASMSTKPLKQVILAAYFPGVNNTTVWHDPRSKSQIEFDSFVHLAADRRARQARLLLPRRGTAPARAGRQDPRPRHRRPARHAGRAHRARRGHHPPRPGRHAQRDVPRAVRAGPPAGHARPPVRRPRGVERRHLVRRVHRRELPPRRVPRPRRPLRAGRRVRRSRAASCGTRGPPTRSSPIRRRGTFVRHGSPGAFAHHGAQFDIHGHFNVPRSPQGHPVILQAGDSDGGRELAARDRRRASSAGTLARVRRRRSSPTPRVGWPATAAAATT